MKNALMENSLARLGRRFLKRGQPESSASYDEVEMAELRFYVERLRQSMVVFDVGANVGELSLLFSRLVRDSGHVHAFEASRDNYGRLRALCEAAGRKNIRLNNLAVADRAGVLQLHVYDEANSGFNSLAARPLEDYGINLKPLRTEEVEATKIDTYCEQNSITHIDLLKIDVEGAEFQVLLGAGRMLSAHRIRCCTFEFGQTTFDMGNNPDAIEAYLNEMGYTLRNMIKGDPVFPGRAGAATAMFSMHVAVPRS
jgi:FkbM family methyltransferase